MIRFDFKLPKLYFSGTTCTALIHLWMLPRMEIGPASFVLSNSDTKTSRKNKKKLLRSKTILKKSPRYSYIAKLEMYIVHPDVVVVRAHNTLRSF